MSVPALRFINKNTCLFELDDLNSFETTLFWVSAVFSDEFVSKKYHGFSVQSSRLGQ